MVWDPSSLSPSSSDELQSGGWRGFTVQFAAELQKAKRTAGVLTFGGRGGGTVGFMVDLRSRWFLEKDFN